MTINIGNSSINSIYIGDTAVKSVYLGNNLVYSSYKDPVVTDDSYNYFVFDTSLVSDTTTVTLQDTRESLGDTTEWNGLTDWDDGTVDTELTHTYIKNGKYNVKTKHMINDSSTRKMLIKCFNINKNITDYNYLFYDCINLIYVNELGFNTNNVTTMNRVFCNCESLTSLDLSSWNTSNVTIMHEMFNGCYALKSLNLSNWDTSNVINMKHMFGSCRSLISLDLSSFNTSKVNKFREMFSDCLVLQELILPNNFIVNNNVTDLSFMFYSCESLTTLDLSNWNTSNVTDMGSMFYGCKLLTSLNLSSWNTSNVTNMYRTFAYCSRLSLLNISNWNMDNMGISSYENLFLKCSNLTIDNIIMTNCSEDTINKINYSIQFSK